MPAVCLLCPETYKPSQLESLTKGTSPRTRKEDSVRLRALNGLLHQALTDLLCTPEVSQELCDLNVELSKVEGRAQQLRRGRASGVGHVAVSAPVWCASTRFCPRVRAATSGHLGQGPPLPRGGQLREGASRRQGRVSWGCWAGCGLGVPARLLRGCAGRRGPVAVLTVLTVLRGGPRCP